MRESPPTQPRQLLVRGVNWLGDAVMTTPALQRLRQKLPETHISLLTPAKLAELWAGHPSLNSVLTFGDGESSWRVGRRLREAAFDAALVLPNSPRSALDVWLAGIPRRVGYARAWRRWLLTEALPPRPDRLKMKKRSIREIHRVSTEPTGAGVAPALKAGPAHQIYEYLHLVAETFGALEEPLAPLLGIRPEEVEQSWTKFDMARPPGRPVICVAPGAEYGPAKRWPSESFITSIKLVQLQHECFWVLLGAKNDAPAAAAIQSAGVVSAALLRNLVGQTSLRELMGILARGSVLLANDSGTAHVAAALGVPVVVPFGSTSPELTAPGLPGEGRHHLLRGSAPCAPCFRRECPIDFRCMTSIPAERVADALLQVLALPGAVRV